MQRMWARLRKSVEERSARNWKPRAVRNCATSGMVSFTFDDVPQSAVTAGARILEEAGARGTFYVSGSLAGSEMDGITYFTAADLEHLAGKQHEIGCHTFGHLRLPATKARDIEADLDRNAAFFRDVLGVQPTSFAYPFGHASIPTKALIGRRFRIARGIWPGVNAGAVDVGQLLAFSLDQIADCRAEVEAALDATRVGKGWVIFFTHDVSNQPSRYGTTPAELRRILNSVLSRGLEVHTVEHAMGRLCAKRGAVPDRLPAGSDGGCTASL